MLEILRESSKDAVANAVCESFGNVRKYLHLKRPLEGELKQILEEASDSSKGQLVLVCGNVGDGKSHVISMVLQVRPELRELFDIYDDATESSSPSTTNIEELQKILSPFSDSNIDSCHDRIVLAINLGTLNNFIVADEDSNFTKLKAFVHEKQILEIGQMHKNCFDENSCFQFVNFSDHNLFYLTSDGPVSSIVETALERVASKGIYDNPFHDAYINSCDKCPARCPIKSNYELLLDAKIRKRVSALIIQCIVKYHHIISIRALYNFIFDLIVPVNLDGLSTSDITNWVNKSSSGDFLQSLFPNYLFEHPEVSNVFDHLQYLDPALRRSSHLDDQIVSLVTREDPYALLVKLDAPESLLAVLYKHASESNKKGYETLVKTYVRLIFLTTAAEYDVCFDDTKYAEFMKLLYGWYNGERAELKDLYKLIQRVTMAWGGKARSGEMLLELGNQQLKYRLSEKVSIKSKVLPSCHNKDEHISKFHCILPLEFTTGISDSIQHLNVDYRLYEIAEKVDTGYMANQMDKDNFISFSAFVNDVMNNGELGLKLRITESNTGRHFILEKDDFGDFTFSGEKE